MPSVCHFMLWLTFIYAFSLVMFEMCKAQCTPVCLFDRSDVMFKAFLFIQYLQTTFGGYSASDCL